MANVRRHGPRAWVHTLVLRPYDALYTEVVRKFSTKRTILSISSASLPVGYSGHLGRTQKRGRVWQMNVALMAVRRRVVVVQTIVVKLEQRHYQARGLAIVNLERSPQHAPSCNEDAKSLLNVNSRTRQPEVEAVFGSRLFLAGPRCEDGR